MKARLHFDSFGHVRHLSQAAREEHFRRSGVADHAPLPAGTIIDDPDAWQLVRNGHADPADDECRIAAGLSHRELSAARDRFAKLNKRHAGSFRAAAKPRNVFELNAVGQDV